MVKSFETERAFIESLDSRQLTFFTARERDRAERLQRALLSLSRGMSDVSALNGETQSLLLHHAAAS